MAGVVKNKYQSDTRKLQKSFTRPLAIISDALPEEYDRHVLLRIFKEAFPLQWDSLNKRYEQYKSKDNFLVKIGKKKRYYHDRPDVFIFKLPKVKYILSDSQRSKHKKEFNEKNAHSVYESLLNKAKTKNSIHEDKMLSVNRDLQMVDPLYFDVFIASYHKRGITTQEKIEIFQEMKKYNNKKVVVFFQKLNDSENNDQIRKMAFEHLQKLGAFVRLRKKFKGKVKSYNSEEDEFNVSPEDFLNRIEFNTIQNKNHFMLLYRIAI